MKNYSIAFFFTMVSFFICYHNSNAQVKNILIGGNLTGGPAIGDFKNGYKSVFGLEGFIGGGSEKVFGLLTAGYFSYSAQDGNIYGKIKMLPLKGGLRIYATKKLFLAGNAGIGLLKDEVMTSSESRFVYDMGAGFHNGLGSISVFYDGWVRKNNNGTSNTIQVKLGFALR
jgi:hypothetical protein